MNIKMPQNDTFEIPFVSKLR